MNVRKTLIYGFCYAILLTLVFSAYPDQSWSQSNPCAPKAKKSSRNPCAANPCAANPCAVKASRSSSNPCAANPCAANPCAANPCAPGASAGGPSAKAIMARGHVVKADSGAKKLIISSQGKQLDLTLGKYSVVREGPKTKSLKDVKAGDKVTVSYVESGRNRTAWYVYLASAASVANPCGGNPCAVRNPCAANPCAANPCAVKAKRSSMNPCAANPCAAKNPCAANPCAAKGKRSR